jgi:signal transduction histidine kinase/ActR/RegA family two-component response regulator
LKKLLANGALHILQFFTGDRVGADEKLAAELASAAELRRANELLREELMTADCLKDEFLATASHELRTPLNAILGWARMLRAGQLDPSVCAHALEVIERNANAQVHLIEDILDGSRMTCGKIHLGLEPLDMTALVSAALDAVCPAAHAKGIRLTVALDPAAARIVGDPERLQQIVWNIANNAIKFTPQGGTVAVRLERAGSDIELVVADSGQGISAKFLPRVFERCLQAEGSSTRRHGGLGLGLALVRHLAEAHGGTVRAESAGEGHGSTFILTLPVQAEFRRRSESEHPDPTAAASEPAPLPLLNGVSVLVVDDAADARELVATVLRTRGAEVRMASDVESAIESVSRAPPTLLISDLGMPAADGFELIRRLRTQTGRQGSQIPAIALTAYTRQEDRRRALQAGFQTYVAKPVEPAQLVRVVASLLEFVNPQPSARRLA